MKLFKKALRHKGKEKCSVPVCLCASVPDEKGFSFMELMVVVAIMGMLIAASMPVFRSFTRGRNIKEGTTMVMSALRKTKEAAITYRKNYRTVLDTTNQAVGIYLNENGLDTLADNWTKLPDFVVFDTNPAGDWHTGNVDRYGSKYSVENIYWIEFKPTAAVNGVGFNEQNVVLKEESTGDIKVINVNALTGRIKVK